MHETGVEALAHAGGAGEVRMWTATVDARRGPGRWSQSCSRRTLVAVSWIDRMLEDRLSQAAANGELDAGPLHGKPFDDLDRPRPQGWWAEQFVRRELSHDRAKDARSAVAVAQAGFWRAETVDELHERVRAANADIVRVNVNLVEADRLPSFDRADVEARWRRLRR